MKKEILRDIWHKTTIPQTPDPDIARQEYMTKVILVILSTVSTFFTGVTLIGWIAGVIPFDTFVILLILSALFDSGWWLAHSGRWQIAGYIPIIFILLTAAYGSYVGGIDAPAMVLYVISIVLAIILKNRAVQWIILGLSLLFYLGFGLAHAYNYLPPPRTSETVFVNRVVITILALICITLLLQFLDTQLRRTLNQSRAYARKAHTSAERIRGMFETTLDGIIFTDLQGRLIDVNEATVHLHQYKNKEEIIGLTLFKLIAENDREKVAKNLDLALQTGHSGIIEYLTLPKTGQPRHVEMNMALFKDEGENPSGFVTIIRDITDRKQAEEALRQSEERFRLFSEQARDAIFLHDDTGKILDVNNEACTSLGYTRDELLRLKTTDIDGTFNMDTFHGVWETIKDGEAMIIESTHRRKDNTIIPVEVNVSKFPLDNKTAFLVMARDTTSRREIQEQLRKLWRAIEQSHNIVVITNRKGQIEYVNPKFTQLTGYSQEEVLGKTPNILKSGQQPSELYNQLWHTISSGDVWQGEFQNKKKNGELYWEFASISPVRDTDNKISHYVKAAEDITERKQTEKALLQASRMETAATLAGGIAHKVNNLMTAVLGYAELLKSQLPDNPDALQILTTISKSARQTGELAQQMLAFARGGKYELHVLNINDIIQKILPLQKRDLSTQINIEQDMAADLWDIEADPTQMSQVVLNLLTNAVEAIEEKGAVKITTQNQIITQASNPEFPDLEPGSYVCLTVQDSGSGIDSETLARIFEPFFTTKFQGRGMGLAAVYGIVNNHGGKITVDSEPNKNTSFRVCLPAIQATPKVPVMPTPPQEVSFASADKKDQTILIADDDPIIVEVVQKLLTILGYQSLVAENGKKAIELAQTFAGDIDLVLLDLGMPVMNGAEAYPHLVEARPEMKVIIFSGYKLDKTAQSLLEAGASTFIQKPFQLDELRTEIFKALGGQLKS